MTRLAHSWYRRPMDAKRFISSTVRIFSFSLFATWGAALALGCEENSANASASDNVSALQVSHGASSKVVDGPPAKTPGTALTGKAKFQEAAFELELKAPPKIVAGAQNRFTVILHARDGFKVNAEYPLKFKFAESAGVEPAKKIVRKEDAKLEEKLAEIPLDVTLTKSGKLQIAGKISFSVCTEERCLIEKRDLILEVNVT